MATFTLIPPVGARAPQPAAPRGRPLAGGSACARAACSSRGQRAQGRDPHAGRDVCCSAAAQQEQAGTLDSEDFRRLYERETPLISRMLEEIELKGQVFEQASDLAGEPTDEKRQAVREVVEEHYEEMSQGLLMVLAGYAHASYVDGHREIGFTLETIREEVLRASLGRMPPEMQAMDRLVNMFPGDREARVEAAKAMAIAEAEALAAEEADAEPAAPSGVVRTDLATLRRTATQLIDDMEELEGILDTSLLAKMCLVREEVDEAAAHLGLLTLGSPYHGLMCASWRLLPAGPSAFVKELIPVASPEKRRALLTECVVHDFQSSSGSRDARLQHWRREKVRPGRLLNTLAALLTSLASQGESLDSPEVQRLRDIKADCLELLQGMADA